MSLPLVACLKHGDGCVVVYSEHYYPSGCPVCNLKEGFDLLEDKYNELEKENKELKELKNG